MGCCTLRFAWVQDGFGANWIDIDSFGHASKQLFFETKKPQPEGCGSGVAYGTV